MSIVQSKKDAKDLALYIHGNRCRVCGYDKCKSALEFHHLNPKGKDFNISEYDWTGSNINDPVQFYEDKIKPFSIELSKVVLLCSNCHRECHSGVIDVKKLHRYLIPIEDIIIIQSNYSYGIDD